MWRVFALLIFALTASAQQTHPILALGSPAPNFELPGVDGAIHPFNRMIQPLSESTNWIPPTSATVSKR
jgi:hypothetical protein